MWLKRTAAENSPACRSVARNFSFADAEKRALHFRIARPGEARQISSMLAAFVLLFVVVAYRIVSGFAGNADFGWLHNFAPIAAVALCGAAFLPRRIAIVLPLAALFVSDVVLYAFVYHQPLLTAEIVPGYVALAIIAGLGLALREKARLGPLLGASFVGSLIFHILTNTGAWLSESRYANTFAGWIQALTTGLPGFPPAWIFFRNTLISDLLFTALFVACMHWQARKEEHEAPAKALAPW